MNIVVGDERGIVRCIKWEWKRRVGDGERESVGIIVRENPALGIENKGKEHMPAFRE